jgi:4-aminobutyrate aminotransferase
MAAVEFASPAGPSAHDPLAVAGAPAGMSARVTKRCLEKGMLLLGCSAYEVRAARDVETRRC